MASFKRKLKRKLMVQQRKRFMKDFKQAMSTFKMQVKCKQCERPPVEGESIDNWLINKNSENIDLICTDCYNQEDNTQGESNETEKNTEL